MDACPGHHPNSACANVLCSLPRPPCLTQGVFGEKPNLPEYKVAAIRKSPFILLHCGALRATWDGFILLATLYVAVTVPYSVCVSTAREPSAARGPPSVCDLAVEVLFILGMCALCLPPHPMPGAPWALMGTSAWLQCPTSVSLARPPLVTCGLQNQTSEPCRFQTSLCKERVI